MILDVTQLLLDLHAFLEFSLVSFVLAHEGLDLLANVGAFVNGREKFDA